MKKEEFLKELKQYLHVLEDKEQEDILQEYEQHIEMKINKGLNEEEAIRDFGPVRELAAEILEAYHVKLESNDMTEENVQRKAPKKPRMTLVSPAVHTVKIRLKNMGKGLLKGTQRLWILMRKPFEIMGKMFVSWKENLQNRQRDVKCLTEVYEESEDVLMDGMKKFDSQILCGENTEDGKESSGLLNGNKSTSEEKTRKKRMKKRMILSMFVKGIRRIYDGILNAVCWAGRMLWNCGVVCAALVSAFMGLVFLYLFGMLFVLWKEGYPLGGVMLGCMGAVLCFISLAVFGSTFYRKKKLQ